MARKEILGPEGPIRNVGYARVSTQEQKLDLQLDALRRVGVWEDNLHVEKVSGAGRKRPALDLAIMDLRAGDTLIVWRLDRLARNMRDLLARMEQIEAKRASFKSLTEAFDTNTAGGRFLLYVLGAVAELERQLTIERTSAGIESWRQRGGKPGRERKMTPQVIAKAKRLIVKDGLSTKKTAKKLRVSVMSLYAHGISRRRLVKKR